MWRRLFLEPVPEPVGNSVLPGRPTWLWQFWGRFLIAHLTILAMPAGMAEWGACAEPAVVQVGNDALRVGLDTASGTLRELSGATDGSQQLGESQAPFALWQLVIREGDKTHVIGADEAGPVQIQKLTDGQPGLQLRWDAVPLDGKPSLRVAAEVRIEPQGVPLSRWSLTVAKPQGVRLKEVRFPRVAALKPRANEELAVPQHIGTLASDPRQLLRGKNGKGQRLTWHYPARLSMQWLAWYEPDGLGFYAAADDTRAFAKTFALWGDAQQQVHFEMLHEPEQEAAELAEFRLPYGILLGTFRGDWSTAASMYRQSPTARVWAERSRLRRGLTPEWVKQVGLWEWNRGRSEQVLVPAAELQKYLGAPVSVFWHWWHGCAYDAGFPEYLPPREGTEPFRAAVEKAQGQGIHSLIYMNQRLWGTATKSWEEEGAEAFAVKGANGKIRTEVYNRFMHAPCTPMCLGTEFWRNKYAGLAIQAVCELKVDGIYMDQTCMTLPCYDPTHGHILGHGRYWTEALGLLAGTIRDQCSTQRRVALAGEYCGEPWLPYLDLMLNLEMSQERTAGGASPWAVIPLFQAVYHDSAVYYGSYGPLLSPPYDEKWPAENAPRDPLSLMDRKFSRQFCLEQARSLVWGQQPTLPNFLPHLLVDRAEEMDYVARVVHTRLKGLKYLLLGEWLRPPALDVPRREIDISKIGTYIKMVESKKTVPMAIAGAWRAADGDVGIALASIDDAPLTLNLPIDAKAYGLAENAVVYRTDHTGRQRLGAWRKLGPTLRVELPARDVCLLEFCAP